MAASRPGGGVLFIAATADAKFRAFESRTCKEHWLTKLDSARNATPITYREGATCAGNTW